MCVATNCTKQAITETVDERWNKKGFSNLNCRSLRPLCCMFESTCIPNNEAPHCCVAGWKSHRCCSGTIWDDFEGAFQKQHTAMCTKRLSSHRQKSPVRRGGGSEGGEDTNIRCSHKVKGKAQAQEYRICAEGAKAMAFIAFFNFSPPLSLSLSHSLTLSLCHSLTLSRTHFLFLFVFSTFHLL